MLKEENLKMKFAHATKWSSITEIAAKIVNPIISMILARLISPEAFGVVATVTMIMSFADMFTDAGFQKYLVQHDFKNENEEYENANVAFWTNFGISIILWGFIIIYNKQIAILIGIPGLGNVIAVACFQLLLTSFSSIQIALFRRNFDFKTLFLVRMVSACIPFIITIPLAFLGFSYWALIIGSIFMQFLNAIILTIKSKWKPKLSYNVKILKEMLSFSIWSLIEAISIWFSAWIDIFVIGNSFNKYYLGLYKTSIAMVSSLIGLITASTVPVLFSALSRLKNDETQFRYMFFKTQQLVSIFIFPLGMGIFLYRDLATNILLGSQWSEASRIIGVYALAHSILVVFGYYCSEVYRAKGKPGLSFLVQVLYLLVIIPTYIISSKYGFWFFVYARSCTIIEFVLVHLLTMKVAMGISIIKTIKNVFPTLIATFAMGLLGYFLQQVNSGLTWSLISIVICVLVYFGILYMIPEIRKEIDWILIRLKIKLYNN